MSGAGEIVVGVIIAIGLLGVVVQVLPGSLLVLGAIVVWAIVTGGTVGWVVLAVSVGAVVVAGVGKYVLAGRQLKGAGVPRSTLVWGGLAAVVGFFVIPVVGLVVGFVAAVYVAELVRRRRHAGAWQATVAALRATGVTILVELAGAMVAVLAWVVGLWLT